MDDTSLSNRGAQSRNTGGTQSPTILATVLPGLEKIAADEISSKLTDVDILENTRGKVLFTWTEGQHGVGGRALHRALDRAPDCAVDASLLHPLFTLRSVDNLYLLIDRFSVGPHRPDLQDLRSVIRHLDLMPSVRAFAASSALQSGNTPNLTSNHVLTTSNYAPGDASGRTVTVGLNSAPSDSPTFIVNASRRGKQSYSRFEAADAAMEGILDRHPKWHRGTPEQHALEFRLDIDDADCLFSLRLTSSTFRYRGKERLFSLAALRPPVAHAMVWASAPADEDRFLDPFCGSGTIVSERFAYPARRIRGGDISNEALTAARDNLAEAIGEEGNYRNFAVDSHQVLQQWDARHLPIDARSITSIVTNLPFGRQILPNEDLEALYTPVLQEFARVLAPRGSAVVLTDREDVLKIAAEAAGFQYDPIATLSLKGILPTLFRMKRM